MLPHYKATKPWQMISSNALENPITFISQSPGTGIRAKANLVEPARMTIMPAIHKHKGL